jgi:hypothetical protein
MKKIFNNCIFILSYEIAILVLWVTGLDSFTSIHSRAWGMDGAAIILFITFIKIVVNSEKKAMAEEQRATGEKPPECDKFDH